MGQYPYQWGGSPVRLTVRNPSVPHTSPPGGSPAVATSKPPLWRLPAPGRCPARAAPLLSFPAVPPGTKLAPETQRGESLMGAGKDTEGGGREAKERGGKGPSCQRCPGGPSSGRSWICRSEGESHVAGLAKRGAAVEEKLPRKARVAGLGPGGSGGWAKRRKITCRRRGYGSSRTVPAE